MLNPLTFSRGLVIGKFYPPHQGHKYLIDTATYACEKLTVVVFWKETDSILGAQRAEWIKQIHPEVEVLLAEDVDKSQHSFTRWAEFTIDLLGYAPDAVFSSESYGEAYAAHMGARHVLVDKEREQIPISATMVRDDPHSYLAFLEPCVREYFLRINT